MFVLKIMNIGDSDLINVPIRDEEIIIGRSRRADVRIKDDRISSKHICFFKTNNILYFRDLGSTNGSLLNGKPIDSKKNFELSESDEVKIGGSVVKIDLRFL